MRVRAGVVASVTVVVTVVVAGGGCAGGVPAGDGAAGTAGGMRTSPHAAGVEASPSANSRATGAGCNGTSVFEGDGFPEVRGTARDAELWGLLFVRATPLRAGDEVKIVWRMTGEGPLRIRAVHPDGTAAERVWGPEEHGGSSWRRPGQEWGTGFVFPKPGCWKVELSRSRGSGHVWLPVR
ncbi:hypothetical protein ACWDA3_04265 [Nonomuraea rubra]